jgi:methylaspartate ammonia-lyase
MLSSLANSASSINFIDQQQQAAAAASQDGQPPTDGEAAARRKLENMERTVNLDSNFDLLNE